MKVALRQSVNTLSQVSFVYVIDLLPNNLSFWAKLVVNTPYQTLMLSLSFMTYPEMLIVEHGSKYRLRSVWLDQVQCI